jgi:hypothetical protein
MLRMQPVNFQYDIENQPTTTNPVPDSQGQRVQAAMINDFLHPSNYLTLYLNLKSPEIESQDDMISRSPNPELQLPQDSNNFHGFSRFANIADFVSPNGF